MSTADSTGFSPDSFSDLVAAYDVLFATAFGENVKDSNYPDSVLGQFINILALGLTEQNEFAQYIADG
jgi:hypothetical protein